MALARPSHYSKNGFVFVPLFFAHQLTDLSAFVLTGAGFAGFCMAASVVYILNDIADRDRDAAHPVKRCRPLARGSVSVRAALLFALLLSFLAGLFCLLVSQAQYFMILLFYVALNLLYSFRLQHLPVINAGCVATGFVLRVFAGAAVIDVPVSLWLGVLTFLLALFLTVSKRRCEAMDAEAATMNGPSAFYRPVVFLLALAAFAGYLAYTLAPPVVNEHGAPDLYLTSIWVALGLFRYLRVGCNPVGECSPVAVFLKDRPMQLYVLLWIISLWWVIYC